jgi:hypothetical protein
MRAKAEETIDSVATATLCRIDAAKAVDAKGYSRIAYPMFKDARNQWMQLHVWAPKWEPEKFERTLDVLDKALARTGKKIRDLAPPPEIDTPLRDFEDIAMVTSKDPRQLQYRVKMLKDFQHRFPNWEPDMIADYMGQTQAELEQAQQ